MTMKDDGGDVAEDSLVHKVGQAVWDCECLLEADECVKIARAAIAAVFDALAEPGKAAIDAGIVAAEEVVDYSRDTDGEYRVDTPSDMAAPVWKAMLAQARKEALGE